MECRLPDWLQESDDALQAAWDKLDRGEEYWHWDIDFRNLQTDINIAEVDNIISSEQAWHLRRKNLGINKDSW